MGFFGCLIFSVLRFSLFGFEIAVGYLYPLMKTFQMISKNPKEFSHEELKKWLTYWLTIALLSTLVFPLFCSCGKIGFIFSVIKAVIYWFLVINEKGTNILYEKLFKDNQGIIDAILDQFQAYCKMAANKLGIIKPKEEKNE